jgi:arylsulfatase A
MIRKQNPLIHLSLICFFVFLLTACGIGSDRKKNTEKLPNIIVILADDMGIDSVAALNSKLGILTPHLDKLLSQSMHFTDAHSGSSVCSPTRYGLLTGRYSWRSRLKRGIVGKWERPLIEEDRLALPSMLKKQGYNTACIGKWHLGWNWAKKGGGYTQRQNEIDFTKAAEGGPAGCGFDYYFGDDVPNWPPFVWIENGKTQGIPNKNLTFPKHYYSNNGIGVEGWKLEDVLPKITQKSVQYIHEQAGKKEPFFLFFALTSPHTPIAPSKGFKGRSGLNTYADLLIETDWCVGQIMAALEDKGITDDTILIFTSDNGTSPKCNFSELRFKRAELQNHWRGMKADAFEGGHRVPFMLRWPGKVKSGSKSNQIISLVDVMATCADAVGFKLPANTAEDSVSLMPVVTSQKVSRPLHEAVICHSISGNFVVRKENWKIIYAAGSAGWSDPRENEARKKGLPKRQLYNLRSDPKESKNLIASEPEKAKELTAILKKFIERGRSTPGRKQKNHLGQTWWRLLPEENK